MTALRYEIRLDGTTLAAFCSRTDAETWIDCHCQTATLVDLHDEAIPYVPTERTPARITVYGVPEHRDHATLSDAIAATPCHGAQVIEGSWNVDRPVILARGYANRWSLTVAGTRRLVEEGAHHGR